MRVVLPPSPQPTSSTSRWSSTITCHREQGLELWPSVRAADRPASECCVRRQFGTPIACALVRALPNPQPALAVGSLQTFFNYSGPLAVGGSVGPIATNGTTQTFPFNLTGVDSRCTTAVDLSIGFGILTYEAGVQVPLFDGPLTTTSSCSPTEACHLSDDWTTSVGCCIPPTPFWIQDNRCSVQIFEGRSCSSDPGLPFIYGASGLPSVPSGDWGTSVWVQSALYTYDAATGGAAG